MSMRLILVACALFACLLIAKASMSAIDCPQMPYQANCSEQVNVFKKCGPTGCGDATGQQDCTSWDVEPPGMGDIGGGCYSDELGPCISACVYTKNSEGDGECFNCSYCLPGGGWLRSCGGPEGCPECEGS